MTTINEKLIRNEQPIEQSQSPTISGVVRSIDGARLISKRQETDGTYTELWQYQTGDIVRTHRIKKAIIAGTDIVVGTDRSEDGSQHYDLWTVGNIEMLKIFGLPS